jgi:hypothetical protein
MRNDGLLFRSQTGKNQDGALFAFDVFLIAGEMQRHVLIPAAYIIAALRFPHILGRPPGSNLADFITVADEFNVACAAIFATIDMI